MKRIKDSEGHSPAGVIVGIALLAAAGLWLVFRLAAGDAEKIYGETEQQRIGYIESYGWDAGVTRCDVEQVRIPAEFDDVYEQYNAVQLKQGFDLRKYRAHSVTQYTYEVSRTDDDPVPMLAHLLVEDGVIIGADITSAEAGGFTAALAVDD